MILRFRCTSIDQHEHIDFSNMEAWKRTLIWRTRFWQEMRLERQSCHSDGMQIETLSKPPFEVGKTYTVDISESAD